MSDVKTLSHDLESFCEAYEGLRTVSEAAVLSGVTLLDAPPAAGYYVYMLVDPRDDSIFYVGKGKGDRAYYHEREARRGDKRGRNGIKAEKIIQIQDVGLAVKVAIIATVEHSADAYQLESLMISRLPDLTNIVGRYVSREYKIVATARYLLARVKPLHAWMRERCRSHHEIVLYMRVRLHLERQTDLEYVRNMLKWC